jgi:hypothetical protein
MHRLAIFSTAQAEIEPAKRWLRHTWTIARCHRRMHAAWSGPVGEDPRVVHVVTGNGLQNGSHFISQQNAS